MEFLYSNSASMMCPIDGCEAEIFHSRAKYMRHWNERHVPKFIKYTCSICSISCRRRYDMKVQISRVHNIKDPVKIELKTADCNKTVMNNRGFIDPGFWVFKGRTTSSTTTTTSSATVSTSAVPSAAVTVSASSVIATSSTIVFRSTATCTSTSSVPCTVTVVPDVHTVISVIFCRVTILTFPLSFRLHFLLNYHRLHLYQFKRFLLEIFAYAIRLTRPSHTSVKLVIAAPLSA